MNSAELFSFSLIILPLVVLPVPFLRMERWRSFGMRLFAGLQLLLTCCGRFGIIETGLSPRMEVMLLSYMVLQFASILSLPRKRATPEVLLGILIFSLGTIAVLLARTPFEFRIAFGVALFTPFLAMLIAARQRVDSAMLFLLAGICAGFYFGGEALIEHGFPGTGKLFILAAAVIRLGIVPFHLWLRRMVLLFPVQWTLLFFLSFPSLALFLMPEAPTTELHFIFLQLACLTSIYGALLAIAQTELRLTFYYLLLSFFGSVGVGLAVSSNETAIGGVLLFWLTMGLTFGGFGLLVEMIESRVGTVLASAPRGMLAGASNLGGLFLLFGLGSVGFPGLCAFVSEEVMLGGIFERSGWAALPILLALSLNGVTILRWYFHIFAGRDVQADRSMRLLPRETAAIFLLLAITVGAGIFPRAFFVVSQHEVAVTTE